MDARATAATTTPGTSNAEQQPKQSTPKGSLAIVTDEKSLGNFSDAAATQQHSTTEALDAGGTVRDEVAPQQLEQPTAEEAKESEEYDDDEMPLLFYTRLNGSFPRPPPRSDPKGQQALSSLPFSVECTCSVMGQIRWKPEIVANELGGTATTLTTTLTSPARIISGGSDTGGTGGGPLLDGLTNPAAGGGSAPAEGGAGGAAPESPFSSTLASTTPPAHAMEEPLLVVAVGYLDGTVQLLEASSGRALSDRLALRDNSQAGGLMNRSSNPPAPVTAISLDASGTVMGAVDATGNGMIWEYKLEFAEIGTTSSSGGGDSSSGAAPQGSLAQSQGNNNPLNFATDATLAGTATAVKAFSSFMSALTGTTGGNQPTTGAPPTATQSTSPAPPPRPPSNPPSQTAAAATSQTTSTTAPPLPPQATPGQPTQTSPGSASGSCPRAWRITAVQHVRTNYPSSFGRPTVMVLDPAYKRRREKSLVAGFADGRLVLTKRGFFSRRQDNILYQQASGDTKGIQAVSWRASHLACADSTGVRLWDMNAMTHMAQIERPVGARPSLYPTLVDIKPHLCWETSQKLLVAWGDCLLQLQIQESTPQVVVVPFGGDGSNANNTTAPSTPGRGGGGGGADASDAASNTPQPHASTNTAGPSSATPNAGGSAAPTSGAPTLVRRRTIACSMAWELDCVACGVAPFDAEFVLVLGIVPPPPVQSPDGQVKASGMDNELEIQIVSRSDGQVMYSDLLPLVKNEVDSDGKMMAESVGAHALLSTHVVPRMDDVTELEDDQQAAGRSVTDSPTDAALMPTPASSAAVPTPRFRDLHLRWKVNDLSYPIYGPGTVVTTETSKHGEDTKEVTQEDDVNSVDSDDYEFITRALNSNKNPSSVRRNPKMATKVIPNLVLLSKSDAVAVRLRTVDDAISHALAHQKTALALQRGIQNFPSLRKYTMGEIVSEYLASLLRMTEGNSDKKLSLRRMKLAAYSMPVLLGGDVSLWGKWISILEDIPGALFAVWTRLPVRDPVLPSKVYTSVLLKMFDHVEHLRRSGLDGIIIRRLVAEAEGHFLNALLAWGSTLAIKEFIKFFKYEADLMVKSSVAALSSADASLRRRYEQSSSNYLSFPINMEDGATTTAPMNADENTNEAGPLLQIHRLLELLTDRRQAKDGTSLVPSPRLGKSFDSRRVTQDARARLHIMAGNYEEALRCILSIGANHGNFELDDIENRAVQSVMESGVSKGCEGVTHVYVISMIENRNLHQCLLDINFLSNDSRNVSPLFAFLQLVGLELAGAFLLEHCTAPREAKASVEKSDAKGETKAVAQANRTSQAMPLDQVASQLEARPKILFWYLHQLFIGKPELYVNFPKTAIPPLTITALHRKSLDLYIKFAGEKRDSSKALEGIELYRVTNFDTPLLAFLKIVLQLGGISPAEVGKRFQIERRGGAGVSRIFALELAYIMEHFGDDYEVDSRLILELYLKGAKSLMHAVSFAQRKQEYSASLWEILIEYCLATSVEPESPEAATDGSLFGMLLESAALSGADLANLVSKIPPRMSIEGLRPRLVAAVADYRLKLQMHESSSHVANEEKIDLLREVALRARRGARYLPSDRIEPPSWAKGSERSNPLSIAQDTSCLSPTTRTKVRKDRHRLAPTYSLH